MKRVIGGEYFCIPSLLLKGKEFSLDEHLRVKYPGKKISYTFGGYFSIVKILETLNIKDGQKILLPSYLCPTILIPFDRLNVQYVFYRVKDNLEVDIDDLKGKLGPSVKAVFFINYFGFPARIDALIEILRAENITIIEDIVQSFFSDLPCVGDVAFNSFRKFLPLDGSVIISKWDISPTSNESCASYFFSKSTGRWLRYLHVQYGVVPEGWFLKLFEKAEKHYYSRKYCSFYTVNRYILSRCDIEKLKATRRKYFNSLLSHFPKQALFKELSDSVVPLGFPIIIEDRDRLRKALMERNIFCPIHWKLNHSIKKEAFPESWFLSDHILTIPIHERNTEADMEYLISVMGQSL